MIDSLKDQCLMYYYQVMGWYESLTYVQQYFTLFGMLAVIAVIVGLYIVKKVIS